MMDRELWRRLKNLRTMGRLRVDPMPDGSLGMSGDPLPPDEVEPTNVSAVCTGCSKVFWVRPCGGRPDGTCSKCTCDLINTIGAR